MKYLSIILVSLLAFISAPLLADGHDSNRDQILSNIENERQKMIRNLRIVIENGHVLDANAPSGFIAALLGDSNPDQARHRRKLVNQSQAAARAEANYRQVISAELLAATRGLSKQEATAVLVARARDANSSYAGVHMRARAQLLSRLERADTKEKRAKAYAYAEGLLRTAQLEEEMLQAALRRNAGGDDFARMRQLAHDTSNTKLSLSGFDIADPKVRAAEEFMRRARFNAQVAEYGRLARTGRLVDPNTGLVETGTRRLEMARDAELALAGELDEKALRPSRYDIMGWAIPTPERRKQAKQLEQEVKQTPEYRALDFLSPGVSDDYSEHFLALALAVREQATGVNDWRAGFVKGGTPTGVSVLDNTKAAVWDLGVADYNRLNNEAGHMSMNQVDARIARYQAEADTVTQAFAKAAELERKARSSGKRSNPADLDASTFALLKKHNYITGTPGQERFQIPLAGRSLAGLNSDLNLPGDHLLNAISGSNMTEIAVTSYIPGAAAGRVGALLEGLRVGKTGVQAATFATDLVVGAGVTGVTDYIKTGKVDPTRIAIESTFLQSSLGGFGKVTGGASKALTSYIKRPGVRRAAEASLTQALGLSSEAALQSYYQSAVSGEDMSYDTFLANMINGAMSRGLSKVIESPAVADMPLKLRKDLNARQAAVDKAKSVASERLKAVLGDEIVPVRRDDGTFGIGARPGDDIVSIPRKDKPPVLGFTPGSRAEHITKAMDDALRSGKISWAELKLLYAENKDLEPILKAVNERRTEYFTKIVKPAQRMAEMDLRAEFARETAQRKERLADDPDALARAQKRAQDVFDGELELIRTEPRSPGSDNLTSDVDRSIASERVRKKLKEIYRGDGDGYALPASSAKSYDVNEYIDVFPVINKTTPHSAKLAKVAVEAGDFAGLNHAQANQAQGYATAMLHMNGKQREQFAENVLGKSDDKALTRRQLGLAKKSLSRADDELRSEMARLVTENPNLANNRSDLAIKARDNLYGQRTEAIRKASNELLHVENDIAALKAKGVKEGTPELDTLVAERDKKMALIQREWGYTLREGIETYASFTGLDAIVNDAQIADRKVKHLINDPKYVRLRPGESAEGLPADAKIKRLSDGQVDNFLNDQIMMMTHHANGFHEGHEGVIDAGSAMGKYAERAVLALKLQGKDLSKPPYSILKQVAGEMVENRSNPDDLRKVMERVGLQYGKGKTAKDGLLALMDMVQGTIPEARGLWNPAKMGLSAQPKRPFTEPRGLAQVKTQLANRRRLLEDEEEMLQRFGPATAAEANQIKQARITSEIDQLKAKKAKRAKLGASYLEKDWDEAAKLEANGEALEARMERIRQLRGTLGPNDPVLKEFQENSAKLAKLRKAYTDAGGNGIYTPGKEDAAIDARIERLEEEKALRSKAQERYAALETEASKRRLDAAVLPEGTVLRVQPIDALPEDSEPSGRLEVRLGGVTLSVPVVPVSDSE